MFIIFLIYFQASEEHLKNHYSDLSEKPFFNGLVKYMASGPVVPMVWLLLTMLFVCKLMSSNFFQNF